MSDPYPLPDVQILAVTMHEALRAYMEAGFTREEAFTLVQTVIATVRLSPQ